MGNQKWSRQKERFAMIPLHVVESPEWHALRFASRCVLVAIAGQFNGINNGNLTMTNADGLRLGIGRHQTRNSGLRELEDAGLIVKTHQGGLRPFGATRWALPWHQLQYRHGKQLDQAAPTRVWIRQAWATQNRITGPETGPRTGPKSGPESTYTGPEIGPRQHQLQGRKPAHNLESPQRGHVLAIRKSSESLTCRSSNRERPEKRTRIGE